MLLGEVTRRVVATAKVDNLPHRALLEVRPLPGYGDPANPWIALDSVEAGPGDTVLVLQEGTGARQALLENPDQPLPAQMVIIGIVDRIDLDPNA